MASKFGQLLLWGNLITQEQLQQALDYQRTHGGKLGAILATLGYITDDDVARTLGMKYGVPTVNLEHVEIDKSLLQLIPAEMARAKRVIPVSRSGSALTCAMEDPTRIDIVREVEFQTGINVQPVLITGAMMEAALARHYPVAAAQSAKVASHPAPQGPNSAALAEIQHLLQSLSAEKLEYVRRFLASIQTLS